MGKSAAAELAPGGSGQYIFAPDYICGEPFALIIHATGYALSISSYINGVKCQPKWEDEVGTCFS